MPELNSFDFHIMSFIQENLHNAFTDFMFPYITYLGQAGAIWLIVSFALLFKKEYRLCGIMILFALLITFISGELIIKNVVMRPRPYMDYPNYTALLVPKLNSFSFPSGHSASSFTAATVLFYFSRKIGIAALLLAFLISFSRIFLFMHYPSDVLVGIILGISFALITILLQKRLAKRNPFFVK